MGDSWGAWEEIADQIRSTPPVYFSEALVANP